MLNNGAAGQTHSEIQATLGYGDLMCEQMNVYFAKMIALMTGNSGADVTFEMANAIWIDKNFPVLQPFIQTNHTYYAAEVRNGDFANPAIVPEINAWCAEKTHNKITDILQDRPRYLCLINALYLNAKWLSPFKKAYMQNADFANSRRNGGACTLYAERKQHALLPE